MKKSFLSLMCFAAMAFGAMAYAAPAPASLPLQALAATAEMSATSHAVVLVVHATAVEQATIDQVRLVAPDRMPTESSVAEPVRVAAPSLTITMLGTHADQEAEGRSQAQTIT